MLFDILLLCKLKESKKKNSVVPSHDTNGKVAEYEHDFETLKGLKVLSQNQSEDETFCPGSELLPLKP